MVSHHSLIPVGVYGTLRKGHGAHYFLATSPSAGVDKVRGKIFDNGAFPCFKDCEDDSEVTVEIYEVDDKLLGQLDRYEGYTPDNPRDSLYVRRVVRTTGGKLVSIYEYNGAVDMMTLIESGDYNDVKHPQAR